MKRIILLFLLIPALAYGFDYKNNARTGKPDLVTTSVTDLTDIATGYVPYSGANANVNIGAHILSAQSASITGTGGMGYLDFAAQSSTPTAPAAGTARFHAETTQGFTRFNQDNEATTSSVLGRDNVFIARNTSGGTISKGQVVYVTGSTGNVPNIGLARSNATTTVPAVGIALDAITNSSFGQVMKTGLISSINTSSYTAGDSLWVSTSSAGALQNTRPAYPNFVQRVGTVLVSGVGNGSILVVTSPFIGGMDSGTNAASFTATSFVGALTGNASTATTLATGRTIGMTGPITWTSPTFNGSGNVTAAATVTSQTGTGSKFVMDTSPVLITPTLGVAAATSINFGQSVLSYYQTGTCTLTLTADTTPPATPPTTTGYYVRIGNIVTIIGDFSGVDTTGASGTMRVTGLPFSSSTLSYGVGTALLFGMGATTGFPQTGSNTSFNFVDGVSLTSIPIVAGANKHIRFTLTYLI